MSVDAFSTAEADEGVAVPLTTVFALPILLVSPPLGFVTDEKLRWDRRRMISKKEGLPAMAVGPGRRGRSGRSGRRNSMRFQKRQWLTLQVRSEHRGRRAVASGSDRGGTVVLASARGRILGGPGARRAKQKSNAKRRETGSTKPGRSKTETKVGGRGRAAGGWWRLRKVGWSDGGGRKRVAFN